MRRDAFKALVDEKLAEMGYRRSSYTWLPGTVQLLIVIRDELKLIPLKANMAREKLAFELGRLAGMAEVLGLQPVKLNGSAPRHREPVQIDLEQAIAEAA